MLAGSALGTALVAAKSAHAFGSDTIRIGLIGCGRRGIQTALAAIHSESQTNSSGGTTAGKSDEPGVKLVALADVFSNQVQSAYRTLKSHCPAAIDVDDRRFVGLDAYQHVLQSDADVVILATPPGFRPTHFAAAVESKKHVLMEKPVAVDPTGIQSVLRSAREASRRSLAAVVGFSHRHDDCYRQTVSKIHQGVIGEPIFARAYCNVGPQRLKPRRKNETQLEHQLRNWNHFLWLGGDFIGEQHVLGLDIINWILREHPVSAQGQGGWMSREQSQASEIFDHHSVEFDYPGMPRLLSQCRRATSCWNSISEHVHGTLGYADVSKGRLFSHDGQLIWKCNAVASRDTALKNQTQAFLTALRRGDRPNEIEQAAQSTMTAILGRTATSTGKIVRWDELLKSDQQLADMESLTSLGDPPPIS